MKRKITLFIAAAVAALSGVLVAAAFGDTSSMSPPRASKGAVVMTAKNKTLGKTILVSRKGMTLYSLSVERHGRFICTNASCLSLWTPLVVPNATTPTGVHGLGTVKRPTGRVQVTFRGGPLYTFKEDRRPGDVKGNGFKDVGTWLAATVSAKPAMTPPMTGGGYGGYGPRR